MTPAERILTRALLEAMAGFWAVPNSSSSSGSTKAAIGAAKNANPMDLTLMPSTLARMPWANSWTNRVTKRAIHPQAKGMYWFTPGMRSMFLGAL